MPTIRPERVYVINLKSRADRLTQIRQKIDACKWPFTQLEVFPAIHGDTVGVPPEFKQGGGAYGCRQSHLAILCQCLMDGVESVLVLEDDADIMPDFGERWAAFEHLVPDDWEGIMVGGQHHAQPKPVVPGVVRVQYAQRTHAYIARGRYMRDLQRRWGNATVHIDWLMRDWQSEYRVYAPEQFLIGQAGGKSDICGRIQPPQWWTTDASTTAEQTPYLALLRVPVQVLELLRAQGFHQGNWRDKQSQIDNGLIRIFGIGQDLPQRLAEWVAMIAGECGPYKGTPAVYHPSATVELLEKACPERQVIEITASTIEEALAQWAEKTGNAKPRG